MAAPPVNAALIAAGVAAAGALGPALQALANNAAGQAAAIAGQAVAIAGQAAAIAGLAADVAANTAAFAAATVANTAAFAGLTAAVNANTAALAALNVPALAAAASALVADTARARANNKHDSRGIPLVPVPHGGAAVPAFWPAGGFDRADLFEHAIAAVDALLVGYGLPAGAAAGTRAARRNALAAHLGTMLA
jgi:hypothetical protein